MVLRNKVRPHFFFYLLSLFSFLFSLSIAIIVFVFLAKEGLLFFQKIPLFDFLTGTKWSPLFLPQSFGVLPLVSGTFLIISLSLLIAMPVGLLTAVTLSEFVSKHIRAWLKPIIEILAGVPTIVYGYFALTVVTPFLKQFFPGISTFNALSAGIVVGVMILPLVVSLCDDALQSIPMSVKNGAYALGGYPKEVFFTILLPASLPRIQSIFFLSLSRAIGETMAVTLAAGATARLTLNPLESVQTLTAYIVQVSSGDISYGGLEYASCFAIGLLLFIITFLFSFIGGRLLLKSPFI